MCLVQLMQQDTFISYSNPLFEIENIDNKTPYNQGVQALSKAMCHS